jgi:hypothetical protein
MASLDDSHRESVTALYEALGGRLEPTALRPGAWDLSFGDLVLELDEELHFNRYRALALAGTWAKDLPWRAAYARTCVTHEPRCVKAGGWGRRWTSPSSAKHFGAGDPPGMFDDEGSPRWKQRAVYDALKDAASLCAGGPRLARLSVHDAVNGVVLEDGLDGRTALDLDGLLELIRQRTTEAR